MLPAPKFPFTVHDVDAVRQVEPFRQRLHPQRGRRALNDRLNRALTLKKSGPTPQFRGMNVAVSTRGRAVAVACPGRS